MAKRKVCEMLQYDYSTQNEMENHIKEMRERGYYLVDGEFGISKNITGEISGTDDDYKWKFTALFIKDKLV